MYYSVEEVDGQGKGCVATRSIKPGTLVLTEKPQFTVDPVLEFSSESEESIKEAKSRLTNAFVALSEEDKAEYLGLYNMYSMDRTEWSEENVHYMETLMSCPTIADKIDSTTIAEIAQIYKTNAFPNGVCLAMSRMNHACRYDGPNPCSSLTPASIVAPPGPMILILAASISAALGQTQSSSIMGRQGRGR